MNVLFDDFAKAHSLRHGYILAQSLSPVPPPGEPNKLRQIFQSTNSHSVKGDIKHFLKTSTGKKVRLSNDEITGWVEVYTAYWHAIGEIIAGESGKVCTHHMYPSYQLPLFYVTNKMLSRLGQKYTIAGRT